MAERPLYTLYKNLKAQNYDVPNDYNKFESALTKDGKSGADNRHAIYNNLKAQNFDVPDTYERFYSALFEPRSKTSSRAKGGSVPMSAADRARFSAGAAAISESAKQIANNAGRYNRLKQRKQKQQKDFGRVNLGTHLTPFGGDANNVVKDEFAYNPETGKAGAYVTSDNENAYTQSDAEQKQAILDQQNNAYQQAVDTGEIPSAFDVRDKNGNYDLQENIGKNGTYLTEEGARNQFDKKLADAYARKKEIEALIAEDNRQHGNPLLSYSASIGASNGRTAEQSDYRNKLATSLSLVTEQIGALEAVKQYPTSSWGEDALKALDNTAFTAKTWDFGLTDFATMGQMERIKTKMDNNIPLSGSDKMLLKSKLGADAAAALEDEKMGNIYRWTKIAGQSLPFMADFFLTGGYGGITKGISSGALKFAAKRGMGKVSAAILKNTGIVAGDVIGSYAMAGTEQAMKTGADIMQRHLGNLYQDENGDYKFGTFDENGNLLHEGGESMGTALYKGLTSAMVENYTEKLFGHNYGIKKGAIAAMEKHGMDGTAQFFKNIGKSGWYTNSKKWMEKFGINGFGEEVMEEEIGIPLHALLDGDNNFSDLGDAKQQLDIIGGMAISVGSMYAMGAGSRPVKGIYNRAQYYRFRNKVNVADNDAQNLLGDNWADIKDKIDNATNEQMGSVLADVLRQRDTMSKEQINAAVNYGVNLMKMRGYNIAKTAEMNAKEITNEPTTPEEQHQADIDNAYSEGHDADDADKHDIQIQQEDQMKTLSALLGISEQQLSGMSDDELESMTGQDDKLDQAIYDYQLSSARYQGVVDDAQDKVDLAAHQAEQRVDMYTDQSRGSVRNATIKASGGAEDYGVYIISGNIATNEDGSINVSGSDSMILYYDPTTDSVEHADALMFAELGEELPADDVKTQAVADAKENAIKEIAGIIDGTVDVGSQFTVTDADGTEHTYEVLADNGDGTAMITIDGNIPTELVKGETVQIPYPLADLQQMKDLEDQKRLEAAKAEREQMEKERAAQQTEETQPSFDFNQILNDNGNVVLVDVLGKDGNTKYPDSKLFLIRDTGAKAKVVELKSDGTIVPHAVNKEDVATISSMSLDEYKQAMPESSMIEDNSGEESDEDSQLANLGLPKGSEIWMSGDGFGRPKENTQSKVVGIDEQGSIILEDKDGKTWSASFDYINNHRELPPLDENTNIVNEENNQSESNTEENTPAPEQTPAMTLEDGTEVPMLEDGNPDFSKLTAEQTAELYDSQFGDDADSVISSWVSEAKKALDKANNMTVKGKTFIEQKAAKDAKEKAIADAQAAYDSAIAIRDAYNNRQLAKADGTAEGRRSLVDKARRKFARLKSSVKDDAEAVAQLYKETVGTLLHRLYDGTGIDVTDTVPLTAEEYVASNLGAHTLNYEGNDTSKGVKQETGLSREDFAKTQLLAADGKGTTIDALVHSLWDNRPSNLESLDTQDIRNALIGVLTSGFKASEARSYIENIRIAQAEKLLEEQELAAENAAYAEQQKAKEEEEKKKAEEENENTEAPENAEAPENTNFPDKLKEGSESIEVPEDATDENPLGQQKPEGELPFSARDNGAQQTTAERAADVEKNKVDDIKVVDNIVGKKTRKAFERLAKMMGANIQWQYSDKLGNGWIQETKDADGNVHRTIFITLDSSITEGAQFIFGHEMTHQIKNLNPAAYNELTQLVLDTYGSDAFDKAVDETMQRYSDAGFSGRNREYYAEEVVADAVGEMIRDLNLAHTIAMKMSHPLLAAIHEILQKIKLAFFGTEYSDVTKNIIRSIEQAYVKTANGEVTNSETGEDVSFSLRQKPEPKKKGIGYKVFVLKDGKLYPPMVANPDGAATPVGVWLDADAAPIAGESKTGRPQVKQGGKGTQGGSGKLAYRPGWHLGVVPYAIQFNRKDAEGNKTLFPKNFVFAEVEYAADVDYQEEARQEGINPSGKYQHSLAGLKHLPTDGYYMYRTNPNPETDPWVITGAMKVNRILNRAEQAELVKNAGREPQQIQEGDIVTDDVVNSINQEIADAPKFSLKVYHGSGADFTEFDFDHMGEGAGSQAFGWGGYVTSSEKIGKSYATLMDNDPSKAYYRIQRSNGTRFAKKYPTLESFLHGDKQIAMNDKFTEQEKIDFYNEMKKLAEPYHNLYEVEIPEDNGSNYLDWENPLNEEQINAIRDALVKNGIDISSWEKRGFKLDLPFKNVYAAVLPMMMRCEPKEVSQFLSSVGFTGIKYPAGTIQGGAEEGDTNYVIFKPEDMKITEHTKFSLRLKSAIDETETNPSDAQKESGNYKKGHIKFGGYDYTIENPKGSIRSGKDANGKEWKVPMHDTYGYIRGKFGKDGDHLDMFINDKADLDNWNGDVFVVDQVNPDGSFDEHKVMYGYDFMSDAEKAYLANYSKGWQGLGNITGASKEEFDKWLDTSNRKLKPFADYAKVKFSQAQSVAETRQSLDDIKPVSVGAFGNIYNQFRGKAKAAIEFLKKLGSGEATAALHHHTIGDISLVWGDKKTGLDKILRKHPEVVDNLQSIIDSMEVVQESDNRIKLESPTHFAVVSKEYKGEPREQWLLTAYEKRESLENDKSMDTATSSLGGDTALSQSKGSAAKIDNSSETSKENGEKFSLKDEKTLAGVHNITEEKLLKAIKQGGLANPSVAVIDSSKQDHKAYGGISLIMPSDKIAKRTGKNAGTWQGDAYTPTYPQVERQMSNKGAEKASKDVSSVPSNMYSEVRRGLDRWLDGGEANSAMAYMFLHEKGVAPEPKMIQPKFSDEVYNELKFITAGDFNIYGIGKSDAQKVLDMYIDNVFGGDRAAYDEKQKYRIARYKKQVAEGEKNPFLLVRAKDALEQYDKYGFYFDKVQNFVRNVERDHRMTGVDTNATLNDVEDYIKTNNLTDEFNTWLEGKEKEYGVKEVIFDGFTPSGNRRYVPNTLENVSKLMKKQGRNGATGAAVSFQNFAARLMPSYGTLKDIRSKKDLLTSDREKFDKFRDKWSSVFFELGNKCQPDSTSAFDSYGMERLSEAAMTSDPQAYLKKEYNVDFSDADTKRLKEMVKAIKEEHPAMYFETKFERPVRFDEFSAAVVPTTTKKEVKDALKNAGVSIFEYDEKSDADRSRAFNEALNSSDNIRFSLAGERGAAAADKAEERTARMDNLSVARKMEEEKKDAQAIKVATGWERGADGKWRYEMPDVKIKDTIDVGGGHIVKRYEDDMLWNGGKLSDVIDAPELFKAYPQLKDVRIDTDAIMNDMPSNGEYNSKTNTITIHADELKYMNSILNHEIQHAIQGFEGFAKGGSPRLVRGEIKKKLNEVTKQIRQLRAEGKEDEALAEKNRGLYNAYQKNDDYNSYKSLAGEVEARNVSARLNMTPEERRKSLAESTEDVARKDQIFLGVGDVSFSLRDMADGKESGAADMAEDLKNLNTPDEVDEAIKSAIEDMPSGWKMANKKMIHVAQALGENRKAEIAGEEPKFSLKDGSLIKAGTYFSGGGLVEEGLKGIIDPVVAVEYDEKISGVYRNNFGQHIVTADVRDVDPKELVKQIDGEVEYFHASPVCKNYSQAKSNHAEVELDKETAASTAEFINAVKPKVVTIENVKGYKDSDAMKTITDALDANGYTWDADVYNAADYGGYTNRERLIVRAVRDGNLPAKPKKMAHKSGWYEAVADIIPTLTEKKNGVAPWMDVRLKADGIDWRNIDKPLYVMGSAYADGKVPHAFADELLPTLRTKSGDVIVMPDGKVYRAMGRVLARVSGVSDDYKMPFSESLSHTIIGNGIPTQLTEHVIAPLVQNTLRPTSPEEGNTRFSLRYDQFEHDLNQWKKDNNLPKDAQRPTIPQRNAGESAVDFLRRVDEYRKQMALWKTAPTYEQHLLSDDTALGEFNRELQRGSVLKRIAFQDSMLAIRKAQEAIMKEVGVDRLNMAEDAYTAENRSHGKGKNEFEEYNNEFLQPLRKAYHQMKKVLGDSYDNVRIYMMAKHGLERDAQMAFKKSLEADYEDVAQRSAAYRAYKGDMNRMGNDSGFELGYIDFTTWRQRDNALRVKYSPSYMNYRYDKMGIAYDYSGLSALFDGSDFEEAAHKLIKDIESKYITETHNLWDATNAATKKILRDGYKAGMMSKDTYQYVRDMYSHYIPLRGWDGTTADQVWDYIGGGKGAFNQTLKTANGRTSIADDPIAYIENMAESGILLNNKNWVKQHLMLLAQNHPTSLLTLSKAWYVKSTDANGNEEWIPATPQITSQMNSNQVKAAIDAFEKKMEQMAQTGDATQKRDGLNIAYPQTHSEEREHEVRVMKDGEEYVIYVNGDPQLAQAMNNTRAHRVREIQSGKLDRAAAWLGRKMAAAYTSLSPLFIPSNYFRDLTMTLASTAIREDAKYNYLLRKNLATSWNLGFMLRDYQSGKLREKVSNGNATAKEQMFYDFMMNGGETGFVSSLDVEDLKKKFKNDLKDLDRWKANPVKVGHTIMDAIEFLNRAIEDSNRFAVYMTSIQYGRSIDEAVNDAKDVTLNFNRKGTGEYGWQMIRNLYLFINPAVQSLQTLGALVKHHPFKFTAVTASWLASGVLVPIVNAALMSLCDVIASAFGFGGDDDKDKYISMKDKYWQFTKWDRRNNLIMYFPFSNEFVKIPLAQEFRAFYGIGDMIASKMMGGELAEESWSQYAEDMLGQVVDMLPLDPTGYDGNIAVSLMPNAIRPVFELAFNVDFTGKPLFKDTEYNKYDPNFTKAYVGTPDWLVRASKMVNSIGNDYPDVQQNSIDAFGDPRYNLNNPAVVDHVLSSYLGGAYTMGSQVLGVLTKSLNDPKEIKVADIPLFSKFVSNPDDRPVTKKQGDEFWDMKENHDRAANTLSKLKKQAKVDGDYSLLERFYGSEEYKQYKQDDVKVKKYEEDKKKEHAEESGEEYRPHKLNAEDIYKAHATPKDDFEDLKLKQLYTKMNGYKSAYDLLADTAPNQSEGYYNTNKAAIDAIDEISLDKQEISELKKGFLDDGKDAYNAEDMKQIRELRKKILSVLEKANKVVVANQKANAKKK